MKSVALLTTAIIIIMGLTVELATIAEETSEKTLDFSNEMNDAIDCAIQGLPIQECSPSLMEDDEFINNAEAFLKTVEDADEQLTTLAAKSLEQS